MRQLQLEAKSNKQEDKDKKLLKNCIKQLQLEL